MNKNILKLSAVVALAGVSIMGLSACTSAADESKATPSASASVIGKDTLSPVTIEMSQIAAGSEVATVVGAPINIKTVEGEEGEWAGTSSDESVAVFVPGSTSETKLNPGVLPKSAGTSVIKLTNSKTGETKSFTVNVSARV